MTTAAATNEAVDENEGEERPRGALLDPREPLGSCAKGGRQDGASDHAGGERTHDRLLATIFHELRTPLGTASHALLLLRRAPPGGEQSRQAVEMLDRQLGLLRRLVDDMLDVNRIRSGKIRMEKTSLDLVELARRALDDHGAAFASRGVELRGDLPRAPLWIHGDGGRLTQALGNLLGNAAKFTPRGGRVVLALEADDAAPVAHLRLRDSGLGFDPALRLAIFEPFRQVAATAGRSDGGLGLGLAIAKGVVELHGGSIEAWSDGPGAGAEFTLHLPLGPAPLRAQ